jgi:hypothetical protein
VEGVYIVGVGMTLFGKLLDRSVKNLTREARSPISRPCSFRMPVRGTCRGKI